MFTIYSISNLLPFCVFIGHFICGKEKPPVLSIKKKAGGGWKNKNLKYKFDKMQISQVEES